MPAYEVSNHAAPGAESRHNLTYWRYGDYAGIGPGAHGRLRIDGERLAIRRRRAPESWIEAVEAHGHGTQERSGLTRDQAVDEMLMMGLRLTDGVARARFQAIAGAAFEERLDGARLARLIEGGFLELDGAGLRATAAGRQRLDAVLAALLT